MSKWGGGGTEGERGWKGGWDATAQQPKYFGMGSCLHHGMTDENAGVMATDKDADIVAVAELAGTTVDEDNEWYITLPE